MTRFLKMHGLGNDFILLDARAETFSAREALAQRLAHRRFGIGADQVGFIQASSKADAFLDMYNHDGSVVRSCGNMSRCVASLIMEETGKSIITLDTLGGLLTCAGTAAGEIAVDMGRPRLEWHEIPLAGPADTLDVTVPGAVSPNGVCVSMGNPHIVFFVPDAAAIPLETVGPRLETDPLFPGRINVEFVQVLDRATLRMRVWERGTGVTLACGTGACAAAVAAVRRGLADRTVTVKLDGGDLRIEWREADGSVYMTGPVTKVFEGTF